MAPGNKKLTGADSKDQFMDNLIIRCPSKREDKIYIYICINLIKAGKWYRI